MEALGEMRRLGLLLVASREWLASFFVASALAGASTPTLSAAAVREAHARAAAAAAHAQSTPEDSAPERYFESPAPLRERCALSLAPLRSDGMPAGLAPLPPTLSWEGCWFHAPAINFWLNNVSSKGSPVV